MVGTVSYATYNEVCSFKHRSEMYGRSLSVHTTHGTCVYSIETKHPKQTLRTRHHRHQLVLIIVHSPIHEIQPHWSRLPPYALRRRSSIARQHECLLLYTPAAVRSSYGSVNPKTSNLQSDEHWSAASS